MTYRDFFSHVVDVVEAVGATILIVGALGAFVRFALEVAARRDQDAYGNLRKNLGRVILLGLEVLIIADIIRTIVVDQSVESVIVLGTIVLIRIVLSFSLEVEIDGMWPWNQWRVPRQASYRQAVNPRLSRHLHSHIPTCREPCPGPREDLAPRCSVGRQRFELRCSGTGETGSQLPAEDSATHVANVPGAVD